VLIAGAGSFTFGSPQKLFAHVASCTYKGAPVGGVQTLTSSFRRALRVHKKLVVLAVCHCAVNAAVSGVVVRIAQTGGFLVLIPMKTFSTSRTDTWYTSFKQPRTRHGAIGSSPIPSAQALTTTRVKLARLTIDAATFAAMTKISILTGRAVFFCVEAKSRITEASTCSICRVTDSIITARPFDPTIAHDFARQTSPAAHAATQARHTRAVASTAANKIWVAGGCGAFYRAVCCGIAFAASANAFETCAMVRTGLQPWTFFTAILS